jgi:hypothetical protein
MYTHKHTRGTHSCIRIRAYSLIRSAEKAVHSVGRCLLFFARFSRGGSHCSRVVLRQGVCMCVVHACILTGACVVVWFHVQCSNITTECACVSCVHAYKRKHVMYVLLHVHQSTTTTRCFVCCAFKHALMHVHLYASCIGSRTTDHD